MSLIDVLPQNGVFTSLKAQGKKQLLQDLAEKAGPVSGLESRFIFDALLQRERLGSTGIGNGIAIPHGKFDGLPRLVGLFAKLEKPIDFEAVDGQPVDLVFVLMAPEDAGADHLKALSRVARMLRSASVTAQLRASRDADALHAILTRTETVKAA
jgi:nitrogen PTS system EIIA component